MTKDVFAEGLQKHYINRPEAMEETCLADFVSWYRRERERENNIENFEETKTIDHGTR